MSSDLNILIIDDDITQLTLFKTILSSFEYIKCTFDLEQDANKAIELLYSKSYDLVISDYKMSELDGIDILNKVKSYNPEIPVVIITSVTNVTEVVEIMKSGVYDFIVKPIRADVIERLVIRVMELISLEKEVHNLRHQIHQEFSIESIIGSSKKIHQVIESIGRCSEHSVNVLIRGESGTGKELVAHALHYTSLRKDKPFVIVNIAAMSEELIGSELFGHVKGAFTGADKDRIGRFEEADGGTLFIDEIGDITLSIQVKLLRALQFKEFQRIGENKTRKSDVRIIAATSRNLEEMMKKGSFRKDLFYRLNVIGINIPPLRERREDIAEIMNFYINKRGNKDNKQFSKEAMHQIVTYDYPGNVRELENVIEHALVFSRGHIITTRDLPVELQPPENFKLLINEELSGYDEIMNNFEIKLLTDALEDAGWNQSKAARSLGIGERRLRYRIEKLSIQSPLK